MSTEAPCAALQSDSARLIQLQRRLSEMTLMKCVCKLKRKKSGDSSTGNLHFFILLYCCFT